MENICTHRRLCLRHPLGQCGHFPVPSPAAGILAVAGGGGAGPDTGGAGRCVGRLYANVLCLLSTLRQPLHHHTDYGEQPPGTDDRTTTGNDVGSNHQLCPGVRQAPDRNTETAIATLGQKGGAGTHGAHQDPFPGSGQS